MQSLQLHFPPFQHRIRFLKTGKLFGRFKPRVPPSAHSRGTLYVWSKFIKQCFVLIRLSRYMVKYLWRNPNSFLCNLHNEQVRQKYTSALFAFSALFEPTWNATLLVTSGVETMKSFLQCYSFATFETLQISNYKF